MKSVNWNIVLGINSILCALAWIYAIYAAGASIYYWTPWPVLLGALLVFALLCSEVAIAVIEEQMGTH